MLELSLSATNAACNSFATQNQRAEQIQQHVGMSVCDFLLYHCRQLQHMYLLGTF